MNVKQFDAEYTYDYDLDIVNIKVKHEYFYKESIDFDVGVFLDFDVNNFPVNLEILSISKRLNVNKDCLIKPQGNVNIIINKDLIQLEVCFKIGSENHMLYFTDEHVENLKISDLETNFAIV